jgi:hypothetical protein
VSTNVFDAATALANAANDLFPLQGHLGTSLGAVHANGSIAEQRLPSRCERAHRF